MATGSGANYSRGYSTIDEAWQRYEVCRITGRAPELRSSSNQFVRCNVCSLFEFNVYGVLGMCRECAVWLVRMAEDCRTDLDECELET